MKGYSGWYREVLIPARGITHGDPAQNEVTLVNDQGRLFVGFFFFSFLMYSNADPHTVSARITSEESMTDR